MIKKFLQYLLYVLLFLVLPPLFVNDLQNIFDSFCAKQCTINSNNKVLPRELIYMMEERILSITFSE